MVSQYKIVAYLGMVLIGIGGAGIPGLSERAGDPTETIRIVGYAVLSVLFFSGCGMVLWGARRM